MYPFHQQRAFTLVELVVVIVVLGILAVVAIPKFIGLSPEASRAAVKGQYASFSSAVQLYHSGYLTAGHSGAINNLRSFGAGNVDSTAAGWPYATDGSDTELFFACEQLWHGLTDTEMSIAYVEDSELANTTADISYTYGTNPRRCIYRSNYFIKRQEPTPVLNYDMDSGKITQTESYYDISNLP